MPLSPDILDRLRSHLRRHADRPVPLAELAALAGCSPAHLQRSFSAAFGCSPKAWHRASRDELLRAGLRRGEGVAAAVYGAGFGSGSRVYEQAGRRLGMTPAGYARGGAGIEISWACAGTAIGRVLVAATDAGVCFVALGDDDDGLASELRREFPAASLRPMPAENAGALGDWLAIVVAAVAGDPPAAAPPLAAVGTEFQLRVRAALCAIPPGRTWTYAQLAAALHRPQAVRAVARACATNPVAILVPCHRVIRGDGSLAGYRWGIGRKAALLAAERRVLDSADAGA